MPKQRIPLVGSLTNRKLGAVITDTTDQHFVNCYPEVVRNSVTGKGNAYLVKRPGFSATAVAAAGNTSNYGVISWQNGRAVFGYITGTTMRFYNTGSTALGGAITTMGSCYGMAQTQLGGNDYLMFTGTQSSGVNIAYYYPSGGAWTAITDAGFPPNQTTPLSLAGPPAFLDGYTFVMDSNGKIWNSDLNSISAWGGVAAGGINFISAQAYPDGGRGLMRSGEYIAAFGTHSIEFFANVGNVPGSPLQRVKGVARKIGVPGAGTVMPWPFAYASGDAIYFVGAEGESGAYHAYKMVGTEVTRISNATVDKIMNAYPNQCICRGVLNLAGQAHVVFTTSAYTNLAYAVDTNTWWELKMAGTNKKIFACGNDQHGSYFTSDDENLYYCIFNSIAYKDGANTIEMTVQTVPIDHGTDKLKEFTGFALIADTQTTAGTVSVSHSNNDYSSFSTAKTIDMTVQQKKLAAGLGWGRRRSWKITETVNRPFRAEAIDIEWEVSEE
jgi:hypothetical protein